MYAWLEEWGSICHRYMCIVLYIYIYIYINLTAYLGTSSEIWTHIWCLCALHLGHFIWQLVGYIWIWKLCLKIWTHFWFGLSCSPYLKRGVYLNLKTLCENMDSFLVLVSVVHLIWKGGCISESEHLYL